MKNNRKKKEAQAPAATDTQVMEAPTSDPNAEGYTNQDEAFTPTDLYPEPEDVKRDAAEDWGNGPEPYAGTLGVYPEGYKAEPLTSYDGFPEDGQPAIQMGAPEGSQPPAKYGKEVIEYTQVFTDEDKARLAEDMSEYQMELRALEDEKKAQMKYYKEAIEAKESQLDQCAAWINAGQRLDTVEANKAPNYQTGRMEFFHPVTGKLIHQRNLSAREMQQSLF